MADANYRRVIWVWVVIVLWIIIAIGMPVAKWNGTLNWSWRVVTLPISIPVGIVLVVWLILKLIDWAFGEVHW